MREVEFKIRKHELSSTSDAVVISAFTSLSTMIKLSDTFGHKVHIHLE
jgi:hypothetical protein